MSAALEGKVYRDCKSLLSCKGIPHFRMQSGRVKVRGGWLHLCPEGTPDLLAFPNISSAPVPLWVETKVRGGNPTVAQLNFRDAMRRRGHLWVLVDDSGQLAEFLQRLGAR